MLLRASPLIMMMIKIWDTIKKVWIWVLVVVAGGIVIAATMGNGKAPEIPPAEYITAPENNTYKIGVLNYDAVLASDITDDEPLKYQLDDKYISFKPIEIRWDSNEFKTIQSKQAIISKKKYLYKDAFGQGIDIDMNFGERVFEKIVKINSLEDLGEIPKNAEHLEIVYEVKTNFIIDGWNKYSDFEITDTVRLGDFSYIEPTSAWDSYSKEVCEQVPIYDDTDTIIEEYITECETLTNKVKIKSFLSEDNGKLYLTKQIPIEWLKSAQYPIWTDADITYGTESEFESGATYSTRVVEIDTNKFVVCYTDFGGGGDGCCRVASVSGTTMSWGAMSCFDTDVFLSATLTPVDVCKLDTNKFVVGYTDDSDDDGWCTAATVSGETIGTYGTRKEFGDDSTQDAEFIVCATLDTDKFVISYRDETDSDTGKGVVGTVSGTTITTETPIDFHTTDYSPAYMDSTQLDTDKFVTCFSSQDGGDDGFCIIGTVSVTTLSFGAALELDIGGNNANYFGVSKFNANKFVASWRNTSDTSGETLIATLVDTTITWGEEVIHDTDNAYNNATEVIDATHFVLVYQDAGNSNKGTSIYSSVADTTISLGSKEIFNDGATGGSTDQAIDIDLISANKVAICFQDDADGDKGKCIIGDTPSAEPPSRRIIIIE